MIQYVQLPKSAVVDLAPHLMKRLEAIAGRSTGRTSPMAIAEAVLNEEWYLWAAIDDEADEILAVVATTLEVTRTGLKVAGVVAATGDDRKRWRDGFLRVIEGWARDNDCGLIEVTARPGWEREIPDYKKTHVVLEKVLS